MNAFCASENLLALMRIRSSPSRDKAAENSRFKRSRFRGSDQDTKACDEPVPPRNRCVSRPLSRTGCESDPKRCARALRLPAPGNTATVAWHVPRIQPGMARPAACAPPMRARGNRHALRLDGGVAGGARVRAARFARSEAWSDARDAHRFQRASPHPQRPAACLTLASRAAETLPDLGQPVDHGPVRAFTSVHPTNRPCTPVAPRAPVSRATARWYRACSTTPPCAKRSASTAAPRGRQGSPRAPRLGKRSGFSRHGPVPHPGTRPTPR